MTEQIWEETCFTCVYNNGFFYGPGSRKITCKILSLNSGWDHSVRNYINGKKPIGGGIPIYQFRIPNTSSKYRKCSYFSSKNNKEKSEVKHNFLGV